MPPADQAPICESAQTPQMDLEAPYRRELIGALGPAFLCVEEIDIEHPILLGLIIRADVVAIPVEQKFWAHALAFEVKCYDHSAGYSKWSAAIRQASDYVLGKVRSTSQVLAGRRISASLLYPAPRYLPYVPRQNAPEDVSNLVMVAGAFHCASHSRVGRASRSEKEGLTLSFGPNEFWTARRGFTAQAKNLLVNKRPIGSRNVDVCTILDGLDFVAPEYE